VEIGARSDDVPLLNKEAASRGDSSIEVVDGVEVLVGEGLVDEGPEVLSAQSVASLK
jgi:hypothetical protein